MGISICQNISSNKISDSIPSSLASIVKVQNKVLRAIYRKPNYNKKTGQHRSTQVSVTKLYKDLKVLKLCDLYYYNLAVLAHDYFHGNTLPAKLSEKLCKQNDISTKSTRNTTNNLHFRTPTNVLSERKSSIAISAYWNYLPTEIKSCKSKNTFKKKLKGYLIEAYA